MDNEAREIAEGLDGRQVRFIRGIANQDFVPACRWEDRARQKLRRAGLVQYQRKGGKWLLTEKGLRVRTYLEQKQ